MAHHLLQVNFKFNVTREQYESTVSALAQEFAAVTGCIWKVRLMNEEGSEASGIFLFAEESSVGEFNESDLVQGVLSHPALSDFSIKRLGVLAEVSRVTRAPLSEALTV